MLMLDYEEAIVRISKVVLSRQDFVSQAKLKVPVFSVDVLCVVFSIIIMVCFVG